MLRAPARGLIVRGASLPVAARRIATWSTEPVEKRRGEKEPKNSFLVNLVLH